MAMLTVSILTESVDQAHAAAAIAAERGGDLVEYRIDTWGAEDRDAVGELVTGSPLPCIVTCRPTWEGGQYDGDEADRLDLIRAAVTAGATYVDVELVAAERSADWLNVAAGSETGLVLSSHDFETRPSDLLRRVARMSELPQCRVVKVAWAARSLRDNVQAMELIRETPKPTVALCMGEFGRPSRVLAGKFGGFLTFCGLDENATTAPGQVSVEAMKALYRWDGVTAKTAVYGIIGWPVAHSMSPAIHNAGFDRTGHDGVYVPMPIPPEYEHFKATVSEWLAAEGLNFRGASVTLPHKENLIRYVRESGGEVDALAEQIGAANTLVVRADGSLFATNTDYSGAMDALCDAMGGGREVLADQRVAVVGAGGVARAVVAGLVDAGATVVVYNRTVERAEQLAKDFSGTHDAKVVAATLANLPKSCCGVYINCTSVGMTPDLDGTPIPEVPACWGKDTVVFDTIYNPVETRLLREASDAGCTTVTGVGMFVRQAAGQFALWTGQAAPLDVFQAVVERKLSDMD